MALTLLQIENLLRQHKHTGSDSVKLTDYLKTVSPEYAANEIAQVDSNKQLVLRTLSAAGIQAQDVFLDDIAALADPGADRILFWDDTAGILKFLTVGDGLSISDITLAATASSPVMGTGQALRLHATGTGTQDIAHGLGVKPKLVIIHYHGTGSAASTNVGVGTATDTDDETLTYSIPEATNQLSAQKSGLIIHTEADDASTDWAATLSALDATNITLDFTTANAGTTIFIQWYALA